LQYTVVEAAIYGVREQLLVPLRARNTALFHSVHYNVPVLHRGPLVVTIHDLTHLMFPEMLPNRLALVYAQYMLLRAVRQSRLIVAISEFTKEQLISQLGAEPEKIRVIYRGIDGPSSDEVLAAEQSEPVCPSPFILFVGNLKPHKNLGRLIQAFALLRTCHRVPHKLVIAGEGNPSQLRAVAQQAGVASYVAFTGFIEASVLNRLYLQAALFVMPSLSEGFGVPPLDAFLWNKPVAAARATALPEVLGDAAVFFDPYDIEDMAEAMWQILDSESLQRQLRTKGLRQVKRYNWRESAEAYLGVYREALQ
jgi:glycosyltransferase involved in cell wall biosynthesis